MKIYIEGYAIPQRPNVFFYLLPPSLLFGFVIFSFTLFALKLLNYKFSVDINHTTLSQFLKATMHIFIIIFFIVLSGFIFLSRNVLWGSHIKINRKNIAYKMGKEEIIIPMASLKDVDFGITGRRTILRKLVDKIYPYGSVYLYFDDPKRIIVIPALKDYKKLALRVREYSQKDEKFFNENEMAIKIP